MHEYKITIAPMIMRPKDTYRKIEDFFKDKRLEGELSDLEKWTGQIDYVPNCTYSSKKELNRIYIEQINDIFGVNIKKI